MNFMVEYRRSTQPLSDYPQEKLDVECMSVRAIKITMCAVATVQNHFWA
jgi:hypothetical protein